MDRQLEGNGALDEAKVETMTRDIAKEQKQALALAPPPPRSLAILPKNYTQVKEMAVDIFDSEMAPDSYKSAQQVAIGIQKGLEINLPPITALQYIAVIDGRPYLWGDATVALVRASGKAKYVRMSWDEESQAGICKSHRKGEPDPQTYEFSMEDAKKANLANKTGPWKQYPKRMCMWRAAAWLFRDVYADVLLGMPIAEELEAYPGLEMVETSPGKFALRSQEGVSVDNPLDDPLDDKPEKPAEPEHDPETGEIVDAEFEEVTQEETGGFGEASLHDDNTPLDPDTETIEQLRLALDGCVTIDEVNGVIDEFIPSIDAMAKDKIQRANKMSMEAKTRVQNKGRKT